MEDGATARQTGIGARQQIDPDTLLECVIGPQPLDNNNAPLQSVERARTHDDAAAPIADAHAIAIIETKLHLAW